MYYVIVIWGFLTPTPLRFVITLSTERNQKLPFSDPPPLFCDYVIRGWSFERFQRFYSIPFVMSIMEVANLDRLSNQSYQSYMQSDCTYSSLVIGRQMYGFLSDDCTFVRRKVLQMFRL